MSEESAAAQKHEHALRIDPFFIGYAPSGVRHERIVCADTTCAYVYLRVNSAHPLMRNTWPKA